MQVLTRCKSFTDAAVSLALPGRPASARPRAPGSQQRRRRGASCGRHAGLTPPGVAGGHDARTDSSWAGRLSWAASPNARTAALQNEVTAMASRLLQHGHVQNGYLATKGSTCAPFIATKSSEPAAADQHSRSRPVRPGSPANVVLGHSDSSGTMPQNPSVTSRVRPEPEPRCWTIADTMPPQAVRPSAQADALSAPSLAAEISLKALSIGAQQHSSALDSGQLLQTQKRAEGNVAVVNAPLPAAAQRQLWPSRSRASAERISGCCDVPLDGNDLKPHSSQQVQTSAALANVHSALAAGSLPTPSAATSDGHR
jgi:hypothetical protein